MKYSIFTPSQEIQKSLSFWQGAKWKQILESSHQAREVFYFGNPDSTFFLVEIRAIGAGFFGAFILGLKLSQIADDFEDCFISLKMILKEKECISLQIEPLDDILVLPSSEYVVTKKFLMPFTRVISLEDDSEAILAKMPQKGRYAVRNAQKQGVEVELLSHATDEHLDIWMGLLDETTKRDKFSHNSREDYKHFLQSLSDNMILALAYYKGRVVAMAISAINNTEAIYYYGASTSDPE